MTAFHNCTLKVQVNEEVQSQDLGPGQLHDTRNQNN